MVGGSVTPGIALFDPGDLPSIRITHGTQDPRVIVLARADCWQSGNGVRWFAGGT